MGGQTGVLLRVLVRIGGPLRSAIAGGFGLGAENKCPGDGLAVILGQ